MWSQLEQLTQTETPLEEITRIVVGGYGVLLLAAARLAGLFLMAPLCGRGLLPMRIRLLLVVVLAFAVAPIQGHSDLNASVLTSVTDFIPVAIGELVVGSLLGLGVMMMLSGLEMAGEIMDRQTGVASSLQSGAADWIPGSTSGRFLLVASGMAVVVSAPGGLHLEMLASLLRSWTTIPMGTPVATESALDLLAVLLRESLILTIRIAAPLTAIMYLVSLALSFVERSVRQMNIFSIGLTARAALHLIILAITVSGISRQVVDQIPATLEQTEQSLQPKDH